MRISFSNPSINLMQRRNYNSTPIKPAPSQVSFGGWKEEEEAEELFLMRFPLQGRAAEIHEKYKKKKDELKAEAKATNMKLEKFEERYFEYSRREAFERLNPDIEIVYEDEVKK